eukprot:763951-Amphidinium_carterae.1
MLTHILAFGSAPACYGYLPTQDGHAAALIHIYVNPEQRQSNAATLRHVFADVYDTISDGEGDHEDIHTVLIASWWLGHPLSPRDW